MTLMTIERYDCGLRYRVRFCIAECLGLANNASRNSKDRCYFHEKTGAGMDAYAASCPECPTLNFNSIVARTIKQINSAATGTFKKMCNKSMYYAQSIPAENEVAMYACSTMVRPGGPWMPKSAEEIKCVIRNLPSDFHTSGLLRLTAFKNYCKSNFVYCGFKSATYAPLQMDMLPWVPKDINLSKTVSMKIGGTCVALLFKVENKTKVHSLQLKEVDCLEKLVNLCEYEDL
ncbi:uncharacterized protein LOC132201416 [Neocloeon triangulifer]|uniref:uncharacterized protein LOC132201416 n=1 Tax=Neocloeon triangulifer TaxID=2078957 RepID=UPI00286F59CC|nr:uncharacterized protein LOC132201416 [Neocloeon triangulifer]